MANWKAKPNNGKLWLNASLEIQILLACNFECHACDQFSNFHGISWVKKATMTMAQIHHFIGEVQAANAFFGRIRLVGGEPSLHPRFHEIVRLLHEELLLRGHIVQLEIVTNGSHPEKIQPVKHLLKVRVSDNNDKNKHHIANMRWTPHELGYEGKTCRSPWHCGWSLNYYGFFPCSAGAGVAKLRDWMVEWQRLELPTGGVYETWPELQKLCNFCPYGLRDEHKVKCGIDQYDKNVPSQEVWSQLAPWLNNKQPDWQVYGQPSAITAVEPAVA